MTAPDLLTAFAALGVGIAAALLGWPVARFTLHLAAGRDRARREGSAESDEATPSEPDGPPDPPDAEPDGPPALPDAEPDGLPALPGARADRTADGADADAGAIAQEPRGDAADAADAVRDVDDDGLLRGGLWIGLLERALVAGGVALGDPSVFAVVVAVKGLGRVPELLRSPTAGERFIIGSLASLGVALGVGVIGRALIG